MPSAISWSAASQNSNNSAASQPASKRQPEITVPSSLSQPSSYGCDKCPHHLERLPDIRLSFLKCGGGFTRGTPSFRKSRFESVDQSQAAILKRDATGSGVGMDLVVSSTLALDATHDVECYAAASGRAQFCTSLLWSRKKAEAARARWPLDLQSRRWRTGSASHSSRRIRKARYRNGKSGAKIPIHASIGPLTPPNSTGRSRASQLRESASRSA